VSVAIGVALQSGDIPDDVVPEDKQSFGQNVVRYLGRLAEVADRLGVPQLESFIVDRCALVEEALRLSDYCEPPPPPEWGDSIPLDGPVTDPAYIAACAEFDRIAAEVDAGLPWYPPAEGLRTVRALLEALNADAAIAGECYGGDWDLVAFRYQLEYAERIGTRFHLWVSY